MSPEEKKAWMEKAYALAELAAQRDEVPVGALFVLEGEIIGQGANDRQNKVRTIAHAEISALEDYNQRTGCWRFPKGTALIVTTEPCLMCTGALLWARVDSIYYGCEDPKNAGLRRVLPQIEAGVFDHRFKEVESGILGSECSQLMSHYFAQMRKEKAAGTRT